MLYKLKYTVGNWKLDKTLKRIIIPIKNQTINFGKTARYNNNLMWNFLQVS